MKKIYETMSLRVSHSGRRYYVALPRSLLEIYDIEKGDLLKVRFIEVYQSRDESNEG